MTRLPPGTSAQIAVACTKHGIRPAEYLRVALRRQLILDRLNTSDMDLRTPRLPQDASEGAARG